MGKNKQPEVNEDGSPVIKERKRWLFFGLPLTFTKYVLTSKSLQLNRGFFTTTEDDLLLFRVMDVSVRRSLFQKMAGLGTLTIQSSDKTNPRLVIKNIKHIHQFKQALDERVEKERLRMRFRTGEYMGDLDGDDSVLDDGDNN
ncbi:MAG TPA: PH domain-containing protein [Clostridiales bacterium]|nr:MAG: Bacterial membrane flanked domain protein [Firmicutes bacterium ADurb.Bin262]HOU10863.1 PH domain-containing protein [Clostridiales bacterium]HQH63984.1 PH domain-containing protein [Clostridiales bacterium]HQK73964.1 PH domain-containing protein [Clostridiales bacterium]